MTRLGVGFSLPVALQKAGAREVGGGGGWIPDQVQDDVGRGFGLLREIVRWERAVWVPAFAGMTK